MTIWYLICQDFLHFSMLLWYHFALTSFHSWKRVPWESFQLCCTMFLAEFQFALTAWNVNICLVIISGFHSLTFHCQIKKIYWWFFKLFFFFYNECLVRNRNIDKLRESGLAKKRMASMIISLLQFSFFFPLTNS